MRRCVAICATLAALACAGVAAADTAQGHLTGTATLGGSDVLTITTTISDGGTSYVGAGNDFSGNCNGDTGVVTFNAAPVTIVCAHYVASSLDGSGPKMRFAFQSTVCCMCYAVWRISDGGAQGTDKVGSGFVCAATWPAALAHAQEWVNKGFVGAGFVGSLNPWVYPTVTGNFTVTA